MFNTDVFPSWTSNPKRHRFVCQMIVPDRNLVMTPCKMQKFREPHSCIRTSFGYTDSKRGKKKLHCPSNSPPGFSGGGANTLKRALAPRPTLCATHSCKRTSTTPAAVSPDLAAFIVHFSSAATLPWLVRHPQLGLSAGGGCPEGVHHYVGHGSSSIGYALLKDLHPTGNLKGLALHATLGDNTPRKCCNIQDGPGSA